MYAMTAIRGVGRRFSNVVCKKGEVDMSKRFTIVVCKKGEVDLSKRAGELTPEEIENLVKIIGAPDQYKIPDWFMNRQRDYKDGKTAQITSTAIDNKLREDLERLKKARVHRGLRLYWGLKNRGQHTKTTGRRGRTVGVAKRK